MMLAGPPRARRGVANSARVVGFLREADRVSGVRVRDLETGVEFEIRAKPGDQRRRGLDRRDAGADGRPRPVPGPGLQGHPSRRAAEPDQLRTGLITRTEKSLLFIIPWGDHWIIGTTDTDWQLDLAHPAASSADIDYLLGQPTGCWPTAAPRRRGRRLRRAPAAARRRVRRHLRAVPGARRRPTVPGLVTVAGGKYTTYRVMAADAVDAAVAHLPGRQGSRVLHRPGAADGAAGYAGAWNRREPCRRSVCARHRAPAGTVRHA